MTRIGTRWLVTFAAVAAAMGCATNPVDYVGLSYYIYGPEAALEILDEYETPPEDRALAEVERAMALLELGRYPESSAALSRAAALLEGTGAAVPIGGEEAPLPWRPEFHERVLVHTMEIADALAMYDVKQASLAADRAVSAVEDVACDSCTFTFTRVLAALAYEAAGRYNDGLDLLNETTVVGRGEDLIEVLKTRMSRGISGVQPEGWAPPPVDVDRTLEVILLLGRGPYKEVDKLAVTPSATIRWCRYLPRGPQAVTWAALETEDPEISIDLTDVNELAEVSLRARADRLVAAGGVGTQSKSYDLRHWTSLPANLQILNFELPPFLDTVDLVYYSPEGFEVDRESLRWPDDWSGGRIFVVRRMP